MNRSLRLYIQRDLRGMEELAVYGEGQDRRGKILARR